MDDARLSNRSPDELGRVVRAAQEALTDRMVERLATTGANALELLDRLNDDATRRALHTAFDRMTELHKVGALDTLYDVVALLHAARSAATDTIVERLFVFFEQMVNTIGTEAMGTLVANARLALEDAARETAQQPPRAGLVATLSLLSKPETRQGLMFLLSFADKLQQRTAPARKPG
jgi:uncharacterized protein YjgD (DUF1641 family)